MRLLADKGYCVERGIRYFREQRAPGIYKHEYINDLFRCAHPAYTTTESRFWCAWLLISWVWRY
jgi:hypothetical protein